jgi:hypothetical protein
MGGSQSGSRHARTRSGVGRRLASNAAGSRNAGQHPAISSVRMELIWEQEAAGSNPAIPTRFFECVVSLYKQGATRRQLSPDAGRRGWVAVHVGCAVAPRCRGIPLRPVDRISVQPIAAGRRRSWDVWHGKHTSGLFPSLRRARSCECPTNVGCVSRPLLAVMPTSARSQNPLSRPATAQIRVSASTRRERSLCSSVYHRLYGSA